MVGVSNPIPGVTYPDPARLQRYVEAGELGDRGLTEALNRSLRANAGRTAIMSVEGDISYDELDATSARFGAALLAIGLKPLDRVIFQAVNSPELVVALLGCLRAGLIPVCTLAAHRALEIGYIGCHVSARLHIVDGDDPKFDLPDFALKMQQEIPTMRLIVSLRGDRRDGVIAFREMIEGIDAAEAKATIDAIRHDPYQVAIFQLSGGTTGVPKVIPRMQNDYLLNAERVGATMGFRSDDVFFMPMPIIHNACMVCFLLPSLLNGAAFAIAKTMDSADWAEIFQNARPTFIGMMRPLLPRLDRALDLFPQALDNVRGCWSADAAWTINQKYGLHTFGMFGMSEGLCMCTRLEDPVENVSWTIGTPISALDEVRLLAPGTNTPVAPGEIGEMVCRGPYTIAGYYNAPQRNSEAFDEEGFYKSGDLMIERVLDGRRFFMFAGRTKDVVDRGGEKINCEEVENVVSTHESLSGCAVIGMPDPVLGERVCAYLLMRPGRAVPSLGEMQAFLEAKGLAKFKWPERLETIEVLPVTKVGKLDKAALREDIRRRLAETMEASK